MDPIRKHAKYYQFIAISENTILTEFLQAVHDSFSSIPRKKGNIYILLFRIGIV
ncbi:MAG: hypothetical protein JW776_09780 [Candidatus Lokiarchaeota archaeon]|nr:hypothetical protein [Candidatus Lokiarchaeota archaeon]